MFCHWRIRIRNWSRNLTIFHRFRSCCSTCNLIIFIVSEVASYGKFISVCQHYRIMICTTTTKTHQNTNTRRTPVFILSKISWQPIRIRIRYLNFCQDRSVHRIQSFNFFPSPARPVSRTLSQLGLPSSAHDDFLLVKFITILRYAYQRPLLFPHVYLHLVTVTVWKGLGSFNNYEYVKWCAVLCFRAPFTPPHVCSPFSLCVRSYPKSVWFTVLSPQPVQEPGNTSHTFFDGRTRNASLSRTCGLGISLSSPFLFFNSSSSRQPPIIRLPSRHQKYDDSACTLASID